VGQPVGRVEEPVPDPHAALAAEIEALREQALREGFEAGRDAAVAAVEAELQGLVDAWRGAVAEVTGLRGALTEAYRAELVELAVQVAQAIVQDDRDRGVVARALVERAIASLGTDEPLVIRIAPADEPHVREALVAIEAAGARLELTVDPQLSQGDVQVRCAAGSVQALLAERVAHARALVLGVAAAAPAEAGP
jgi:flagellar biosynthesis/type III secretory pathway protein FliH